MKLFLSWLFTGDCLNQWQANILTSKPGYLGLKLRSYKWLLRLKIICTCSRNLRLLPFFLFLKLWEGLSSYSTNFVTLPSLFKSLHLLMYCLLWRTVSTVSGHGLQGSHAMVRQKRPTHTQKIKSSMYHMPGDKYIAGVQVRGSSTELKRWENRIFEELRI